MISINKGGMWDWRFSYSSLLATISLGAAIMSLPLAYRSERMYARMTRLPILADSTLLPSLSIIIPVRNEAENLPRLLQSLAAVCYAGSLEIVVVDDNSSDETASIAEAYGATVVRLTELPAGWQGKPYACHRGVGIARGEWLLFTDADTIHIAVGPASAVTYAIQHKLDGLSAFLGQQTKGWWDQSAILSAFVGLFAGLHGLEGMMNGQYILLRRDVYETSGGFVAVQHEPLEDLALGHHLHQLGYRVPILRGETVATVHMYDNFPHMWRGLNRLGAGAIRWQGTGALVTVLFTTLAALPILLSPFLWLRGFVEIRDRRLGLRKWLYLPALLSLLSWLVTAIGFIPAARRLEHGQWALLGPLGACFVQTGGTWGLLCRLSGRGIDWKDRKV